MSGSSETNSRSSSLGFVLIAFSGLAYFLSRDIVQPGFANNADPGARLFPVSLSAILALGGVVLCVREWRQRGGPREEGSEGVGPAKRQPLKAVALMGLLILYLIALPWLGFGLATFVFAFAAMRFLEATWARSAIFSAILIAFVYALFGYGFKVPLPTGVLGLPF